MKLYTLKTMRDLGHNYQGLGDVKIFNFTTLEKAQLKMQEEMKKAKEMFLSEYCTEEDINEELQDMYFCVDDGEDLVHGEIVETELDLDLFAVTTVSVDPYEPASVSTYFRHSKEEADLEYEEIKNNLYNEKLEEFDVEEDEEVSSQDKLDDFINEHVHHDYEFQNGNRYFHLIEEEGKELVISIEKFNTENNK